MVHLVFFTVAASAPLTVLGGGITTTFLVTGNKGTPISFVVLAAVLAFFAVGYAAMSRYVSNAGAFYSYLANGLGRAAGVSGSFIALVAYNTINFGLYGLFGAIFGDFLNTKFGVDAPWWVWGLGALVLVGLLGILRVDLNATVLAVLLIAEILAVCVFDIISFTHPAGGAVDFAGLSVGNLFGSGVGAVLALGIAAFAGFESAAIYSEEVRDPRRTVARATYIAVAFTGLFYALSAWALSVIYGPSEVQGVINEQGPGAVFGPLAQYASPMLADVANVLFITSVFAALLSFHNGVARYLFALGRERVLPEFLGRTSVRSASPIAGSLTQTFLAFVVVVLFVITGRDPVEDLFTWMSGTSAVGLVLLMTLTSASVVGFFRRRPSEEGVWRTLIAPSLATVLLAGVLTILVWNFNALLSPSNPSYLRWVLPGLEGLAAIIGLIWGAALRSARPEVYEGIGRSATQTNIEEQDEYVPVGV
ncbi:APC family permease [Plantactinospora sp. KBS50]|uniref:APC family permease n=1 Tax=Plantactinospora sp. KBS50 TaxID=2024580 RepID=UPI001E55AD05|nr:APC family permease [Plantactinospora sp. KBS50]